MPHDIRQWRMPWQVHSLYASGGLENRAKSGLHFCQNFRRSSALRDVARADFVVRRHLAGGVDVVNAVEPAPAPVGGREADLLWQRLVLRRAGWGWFLGEVDGGLLWRGRRIGCEVGGEGLANDGAFAHVAIGRGGSDGVFNGLRDAGLDQLSFAGASQRAASICPRVRWGRAARWASMK